MATRDSSAAITAAKKQRYRQRNESTRKMYLAEKDDLSGVHNLTADEAWAIYDRAARRILGISAEEFERRWDAGEFRDDERVLCELDFYRFERP